MLKIKEKKRIIIFSLLVSVFLVLLVVPFTKAQEKEIPLNLRIPGLTEPCETYVGRYCVSDLGEYISQFYIWFTRAAAIFAVVMLSFGGYQWIFARGNASQIEKAKTTISGALIGLVLTLGAVVLLQTINPDLVSFKSLVLEGIIEKNLVTSLYCSNLTAELKAKNNITGLENCGTSVKLTNATSNYCCGYAGCLTNQICYYNPTERGDCPMSCQDTSEACRNESNDSCDDVTAAMTANKIPTYTCRSADYVWNLDTCFYTTKLICPAGYENISCREGGVKCYNNYISYTKSKLGGDFWSGYTSIFVAYANLGPLFTDMVRAYCTDDKNAGYITDTICCGRKDKFEIDCAESCAANQVEVSCEEYNEQTNKCFETHPYCGETCPIIPPCDLSNTCRAPLKCCMDVMLSDLRIDKAFPLPK